MSRREVLQVRGPVGLASVKKLTKKQKFKRELRAVPGIHDISED